MALVNGFQGHLFHLINILGKPLSLTKVIKAARLDVLSSSQEGSPPAQLILWSIDDIAFHISENFSSI